MSQEKEYPPTMYIGDYDLNPVSKFQYLGSTISSNLSLEPDISARIAKAAGMMSKLKKRVWDNNNLTNNTKLQVYRACVLSTLLYSSEAWTTYATQEKRLNSFHLRCLRRILGIRWQDLVPNTKVLERAGLHYCPPGPASTEVARTCTPHGRQPHPERPTAQSHPERPTASPYICPTCSKDCHSRIELYSYQRKCSTRT